MERAVEHDTGSDGQALRPFRWDKDTPELREQVRKAVADRRQQHPQGLPPTAPCDLRQASVEGLQQRLDFIQQCVPGRGQRERPRFAFKQPDTE